MSETPAPPRSAPWRRLGLGFAHPGALLPFALVLLGVGLQALWSPPGPVPALVLVADVPLLWLAFGGSRGRWKRWTLLYGVAFFAFGLRWLHEVHPAQVAISGVVLGPVFLIAAAAIRWLVHRRAPWMLAVPTVLVGEEMLRTVWGGGMPWPARSLAFAGSETLTASASLLGAYGLSFLAAASAACLAGVPAIAFAAPGGRRRVVGQLARAALVPLGVLLVLGYAGTDRLAANLTQVSDGRLVVTDGKELVAVQAAIPQSLKHARDPRAPQRIFDRHLAITRRALADLGRRAEVVLWPETMIPWPWVGSRLAARYPESWENQVRILQNVAQAAPDRLSSPRFLLGAIHLFEVEGEARADLYDHGTHDSLFLVDPRYVPPPDREPPPPPAPDATPPWLLGRHDKRILVPGGETMPLAELIPPLAHVRDLVSEIPELDRGAAGQAPFDLMEVYRPAQGDRVTIRAGTVICFELAFPAACRAWRARGAHVLLNAANYGWFGQTGFRAQIRAIARLRAAETPGPAPRPTDDAATFREGYVHAPLFAEVGADPSDAAAEAAALTAYVRWGDTPWFALDLLVLGLALRGRRRRARGSERGQDPASEADPGE